MPTLTDQTSRGFAWMALQAASGKVVSLLGQILLAHLLFPEDFGLANVASTVMNFAALLQQAGFREVLVSRGKSYHLWAGPALWMSFALGLVAFLGMVGVAPFMARFYHDPRILALIVIMAPSVVIDSLTGVLMAKAQIDLRFKLIALSNWSAAVSQTACYVLFAALGFHAKSYAISVLIQIIVRAAFLLRFIGMPRRSGSHPRVTIPRARVNRWKYLVSNSSWLFAGSVALCVVSAIPTLVLAKVSTEAAGLYAFALNMSLQSVLLITLQLEGVLFAALSRLRDDPLRQARAFLRASSLLSLIVMPMCVMQAAATRAGVHLVFDAKWLPAIFPIQMLSIGMALLATTYSTMSLVNAQGRFRSFFKLAIVSLISTFAFVSAAIASWWCFTDRSPTLAADAVALALAAQFWFYSIVNLRAAIRPPALKTHPDRPRNRDIIQTLFIPFALSVAAYLPGWALATLLPDTTAGFIAQGLLIVLLGTAIYLVLAPRVLPGPWQDLLARLAPFLSRVPFLRTFAARSLPASSAEAADLPDILTSTAVAIDPHVIAELGGDTLPVPKPFDSSPHDR